MRVVRERKSCATRRGVYRLVGASDRQRRPAHLDSATEALVHIARVHHRDLYYVRRLEHEHAQGRHSGSDAKLRTE